MLHAFCGSTHTPQGALARRPDDPPGFDAQCIDLGQMIPKTGYSRRLVMEAQYGRHLIDVCQQFQPDVVLSGNTPSIPQKRLAIHCQRRSIGHVFWVQDIYGVAAHKLLKRKIPIVGSLVGRYFMSLDKVSARASDRLIVITEDFIPIFRSWGIDASRIEVIHNWAVLEELQEEPRDNQWAREQELGSGPRFIYSGTLAMKHNPALLLALAELLEQRGDGQVVVVSEGSGVEWLRQAAAEKGLRSLHCAGFQPFERMSQVLGAADVLVAVLEPDAGVFSVPSKVLSYLCAGRPLLAAMPAENLAAKIITSEHAGTVVAPDDSAHFCRAAEEMIDSPEVREAAGRAARQYAERTFDIEQIAQKFLAVLQSSCRPSS